MTTARIYVIAGGADGPRLVRASSQAQALGHVVRATFKVRLASQFDLVDLLRDGVQIENAGEVKAEAAEPGSLSA